MELVFAYGSLAGRACAGRARAVLRDARRTWGVAMDNAVDLPGYKCWLAPDGTRPAVLVAFLDVRTAPGEQVEGALVPAADLAALDRRERQYVRFEVTRRVVGAPAGARVWTYVGSPAARERLRRGRAGAVIAEPYLRAVEDAFGPVPADLPVAALRRVELP